MVDVHLDLELAGTLDLREVGTDVWTKHVDTVPIVAGYAIDEGLVQSFTFPGSYPCEAALLNAVQNGAQIHAWNASFERAVWDNIMVPYYGWPKVDLEQFHCTMAAAACAGLPMGLEDAALAIGSPYTKDKSGQALMKRMARPRGYNLTGSARWWHLEDPLKLQQLITYNLADVEAEREIHRRIPRMSRQEREIWLVDQRMNQRGMPVDVTLLMALSRLTQTELARLNGEIRRLTRGAVSGATQNLKLLEWLQARGYPHDSLAKDTLSDFIGSPIFCWLPEDTRDVLRSRSEAAKTSTAKLHAIAAYAIPDGRARNLVQYGGAVRTLRWAGRGPQIQNFPRPSIKHPELAIEAILDGMPVEGLRALWGNPLDVVSSCLRGVFKAPDGFKFVVCDYHTVEAIVLAWLADFRDLLDVFRRGEDVYVYTAQAIGSSNRTLGKVLRLACGFGMGPDKFLATAASYGLMLHFKEAYDAVQAFRGSNVPIVARWNIYENYARLAIANPGQTWVDGAVEFRMASPTGRVKGALLIRKPSGGHLVYRDARIENGRISFMGVNPFTRRWERIDTYGGKLVENVTQSVARDLLAEAMIAVDRAYPDTLLATIHDELVAMAPLADCTQLFDFMKATMSSPPSWAMGMPLSAAGYVADRYAKA